MTQSTDYDGGKTGYTYDGQNRLTSVTDAEGGQTSYTYDEKNRLVAVRMRTATPHPIPMTVPASHP